MSLSSIIIDLKTRIKDNLQAVFGPIDIGGEEGNCLRGNCVNHQGTNNKTAQYFFDDGSLLCHSTCGKISALAFLNGGSEPTGMRIVKTALELAKRMNSTREICLLKAMLDDKTKAFNTPEPKEERKKPEPFVYPDIHSIDHLLYSPKHDCMANFSAAAKKAFVDIYGAENLEAFAIIADAGLIFDPSRVVGNGHLKHSMRRLARDGYEIGVPMWSLEKSGTISTAQLRWTGEGKAPNGGPKTRLLKGGAGGRFGASFGQSGAVLRAAEKTKEIFITEGDKDTFTMHLLGFSNTIGAAGVGRLPKLVAYFVHIGFSGTLTIMADNDKAGLRCLENCAKAAHGSKIKIRDGRPKTEGMDITECFQLYGKPGIDEIIEQAPGVEFQPKGKHGKKTAMDSAEMVERFKRIAENVKDQVDVEAWEEKRLAEEDANRDWDGIHKVIKDLSVHDLVDYLVGLAPTAEGFEQIKKRFADQELIENAINMATNLEYHPIKARALVTNKIGVKAALRLSKLWSGRSLSKGKDLGAFISYGRSIGAGKKRNAAEIARIDKSVQRYHKGATAKKIKLVANCGCYKIGSSNKWRSMTGKSNVCRYCAGTWLDEMTLHVEETSWRGDFAYVEMPSVVDTPYACKALMDDVRSQFKKHDIGVRGFLTTAHDVDEFAGIRLVTSARNSKKLEEITSQKVRIVSGKDILEIVAIGLL